MKIFFIVNAKDASVWAAFHFAFPREALAKEMRQL